MTTEQKEALKAVEKINELLDEKNKQLNAGEPASYLEITFSYSYTLIVLSMIIGEWDPVKITLYNSNLGGRHFVERGYDYCYEAFDTFLRRKLAEVQNQFNGLVFF